MEKVRLLMIDDEERFCKTTARILESRNIFVKTISKAEEALPELEKNHYDVVLLDLKMPGISGMDILKQIKDAKLPTEVIVLSGHASTDVAVKTMDLDAFDYLLKPCDPEDLIVKVFQAYDRVRHKQVGQDGWIR
jgi:DNA-binding NtrC family response regulator